MRLPADGMGRTPPTDGTSHWRFPVGNGVMIRASGHDQLVERVFDYRLRNNIAIGDIAREISDFYCNQYPRLCQPEARDSDPTAGVAPSEPILNRVARWASTMSHRMPRGGYELVGSAEAERRVAICAVCPKQDASWRGGCGGCSAMTLQLLQQVKALRRTERDGNLGACSVIGHENSTAAHLTGESMPITAEQWAELPVACWRKALP